MTARIVAAKIKVAEMREALIDTARELQQRLQPKTLAREAWESAKIKGADMAEDAVDAVKRRPVATGGIIAAAAMFLARAPIKDGIGKIYDAMTSTDDESKHVDVPRKPSKPRKPRPAKPRTMEIE